MKIPVILARYRLAASRQEDETSVLPRVRQAITVSDNAAAQSLFDDLIRADGGLAAASARVQRVLRDAGDDVTRVNTTTPPGGYSTYGQTEWSLREGVEFFRQLALGCLQPAAADRRIVRLMTLIAPEQRWGLGAAAFPRANRVAFKGGWGPGTDGRYVVRQFGIVRSAQGGLVIGLAVRARDGSFASGVRAITRAAEAFTTSLRLQAARGTTCKRS